MGIRKVTALDFTALRRLPVQLASPASALLSPKKLRLMMTDPNVRMFVHVSENKVAGFLVLAFSPGIDSANRFLVITSFAVSRFGAGMDTAVALNEYAQAMGKEYSVIALLANAAKVSGDTLRFFKAQGYELSGDCLMKKLDYQ